MPIDQNSFMAIQPELMPGEEILWTGRPDRSVIFRQEDAFLIPFSLMWGGFAVFWEWSVINKSQTSPTLFFTLWGIPFVVIGQYLIWGRFLLAAWKKTNTHYAVTNRRVIVVQDGWKRQAASTYIDTLPTLTKESRTGKRGTLRFAQSEPIWSTNRGWAVWDGMAIGSSPVFVDIDDVDTVYRLVAELRDKANASRPRNL